MIWTSDRRLPDCFSTDLPTSTLESRTAGALQHQPAHSCAAFVPRRSLEVSYTAARASDCDLAFGVGFVCSVCTYFRPFGGGSVPCRCVLWRVRVPMRLRTHVAYFVVCVMTLCECACCRLLARPACMAKRILCYKQKRSGILAGLYVSAQALCTSNIIIMCVAVTVFQILILCKRCR